MKLFFDELVHKIFLIVYYWKRVVNAHWEDNCECIVFENILSEITERITQFRRKIID